jgi:hypothetical protein
VSELERLDVEGWLDKLLLAAEEKEMPGPSNPPAYVAAVATSASVLAEEVPVGACADGLTPAGYCNVDERPIGFGSSLSGPGVLARGKDAATPEKEKLLDSSLLMEGDGR